MNRIERRGHRVAAERDYGQPRRLADIIEQDPLLVDLRRQANRETERVLRRARWRARLSRLEHLATWMVVIGTLALLAVIFAPFVMAWWHAVTHG